MLDFGSNDESYAAGQTVAQCSQMVRKGFIRKVYGILTVQLLATAMMCALAMKATSSEKVRIVVVACGCVRVQVGLCMCAQWKSLTHLTTTTAHHVCAHLRLTCPANAIDALPRASGWRVFGAFVRLAPG